MNLLAPMAKPLFRWNHDKVMNRGPTTDPASLALDILMDNEGKMHCGPNLLFHPG